MLSWYDIVELLGTNRLLQQRLSYRGIRLYKDQLLDRFIPNQTCRVRRVVCESIVLCQFFHDLRGFPSWNQRDAMQHQVQHSRNLPINASVNECKSHALTFLSKRQRAEIVAEIGAEQALVNANRELIDRFEKKIQDTLARVWGDAEPDTAA